MLQIQKDNNMPATFKKPDGQTIGEAVTLMNYFRKEGQTTKEFNDELKALSPADKTELAVGAAKMLGYEVVSTE